jgi:ABC-type multidrug transport system fused ATPase/permease subunit
MKAFKRRMLALLITTTIFIGINMYQPILMNQIISYAMSEDKNIIDSLLTFLALLFTTLIIAIVTSQISYHFGTICQLQLI